jgi:hypothetical protein
MLSLQGAASPSLLHHGGVLLDCVRDHARAPTKPHESGVYDNGGARDLPCARGSSIPYFDGGGGYVVACAAFYEWGFSVPSHQFLRSLLQFYDLKSCITLSPRGSYIWRPS